MLRYVCAVAILLVFASDSLAQRRPNPEGPYTVEAQQAAWARHLELKQAGLFTGLEWRDVGPVVQGGRIVDIEVDSGDPYTFYVAYASGGIWKTTNNGVSFEPLFDDQPTMIIADMALDPNDPETRILLPFALFAALASLAASRWIFKRSLLSYRSASS